jgi:hypothetical protein
MSTLYVDNLQPNLGSQVEVPNLKPVAGTSINTSQVDLYGKQTSTTGSTWLDITDASISYTPKASNSKLYIELSSHAYVYDTNASWHSCDFRITVDGTQVSQGADTEFGIATYTDRLMAYGIVFAEYDVTSSSAVTIAGQYISNYIGNTLYLNYYGAGCLKVTEIAQ